MKPTLKAPGYKRLTLKLVHHFQNMLSMSTCAATPRWGGRRLLQITHD